MQRKMQAGISVKLSDVTDATVIGIWKHIYSFLDTADILNGMLVCSAFSTEFRSLVCLRMLLRGYDKAGGDTHRTSRIGQDLECCRVVRPSPSVHQCRPTVNHLQ